MSRAFAHATLLLSGIVFACAPEAVETVSPGEDPCTSRDSPRVLWMRQTDPDVVQEMDRWCHAVGPSLVMEPRWLARPDSGFDTLVVVVWNTHVGSASIDRLIRDLRAGQLTDGRPVRHFALLLQEVFRSGSEVPATLSSMARWGAYIQTPSDGPDRSIDWIALRNELFLYYVPSMRNGSPGDSPALEDRGNAILATVPLSDLVALELPLESQRRVAIAATISGTTVAGEPWELQLVNLHLSHRSPFLRLYDSFGGGRRRQTERVAEAFGGKGPAVVGGDFNTWLWGAREKSLEMIRELFPGPEDSPEGGTIHAPGFFDPRLDHMFFRLPDGWAAGYQIGNDRYDSDHRPLIGWVHLNPAAGSGVVVGNPHIPHTR